MTNLLSDAIHRLMKDPPPPHPASLYYDADELWLLDVLAAVTMHGQVNRFKAT